MNEQKIEEVNEVKCSKKLHYFHENTIPGVMSPKYFNVIVNNTLSCNLA